MRCSNVGFQCKLASSPPPAEGLEPKEFYCNVGLVVEVPRYENRPSVGRLAWAGSVLGGRGQKRGRE